MTLVALTSQNGSWLGDAVCATVAVMVQVWALRFGLRVSLPHGAAAAGAAAPAAAAYNGLQQGVVGAESCSP